MDLMTGLSALSQAIGIAKDLKELDRGVDEAEFKLKLAELTSSLADAKISLSDANLALNDRSVRIDELKAKLDEATNGEKCPRCRTGRLQLVETKPQTQQGLMHYGVEIWKYECDNLDCKHIERRHHDPHGVIPKAASGKLR